MLVLVKSPKLCDIRPTQMKDGHICVTYPPKILQPETLVDLTCATILKAEIGGEIIRFAQAFKAKLLAQAKTQ
jgi:hypothetical protein